MRPIQEFALDFSLPRRPFSTHAPEKALFLGNSAFCDILTNNWHAYFTHGQKSIAMTAPVVCKPAEPQQIAMTAPVVTKNVNDRKMMAFLLPKVC